MTKFPVRAFAIASLLFLPAAQRLYYVATFVDAQNPAPYTRSQETLSSDTQLEPMFEWIRRNASASAVFVDESAQVTFFTGRPVFVLVEKDSDPVKGQQEWWLEDLLGHEPASIRERQEVAVSLLQASAEKTRAEAHERLRKILSAREVFVISRTMAQQKIFDEDPRLQREYLANEYGVYRQRADGRKL